MPVFPRPPLKFRTAGFPQYGFKRTFKPATFTTTVRLKCRPHSPTGVAYTLAQCLNPTHSSDSKAVRCSGCSSHFSAVYRILRFNRPRRLPTSTRSSRGPWLARRLCCPSGSSLTMASSEPLDPQQGEPCFSHNRRPRKTAQGGDPEVPQFTPQDCPSVPSPLPRRLRECVWLLLPHEQWPSPMSKRLGIRKVRFRGCRVNVMLRPGRWLDLPMEAVYFRACTWPVARTRRRV